MLDRKRTEKENSQTIRYDWRDHRFDPTTNFSLLGWLLDRVTSANSSEKQVDFTLDE